MHFVTFLLVINYLFHNIHENTRVSNVQQDIKFNFKKVNVYLLQVNIYLIFKIDLKFYKTIIISTKQYYLFDKIAKRTK